MNSKKILFVVLSLIVLALAAGAAGAQAVMPPAEPPPHPPAFVPRGERLLGDVLQIVAESLGIDRADLIEQLRGSTLGDVITANGGDIDAISAAIEAEVTDRIQRAVADGRLTQERADLFLGNLDQAVERAMNTGVPQGLRPGQNTRRPPAIRLDDRAPLLNAVMDATGLSARDLAQEIRGGSTLADVVTAHGGDPDAVIEAAVAQVQARLDEAVASGGVTAEQATQMIEGVQAFYEAVMNGGFQQHWAAPEVGIIA